MEEDGILPGHGGDSLKVVGGLSRLLSLLLFSDSAVEEQLCGILGHRMMTPRARSSPMRFIFSMICLTIEVPSLVLIGRIVL